MSARTLLGHLDADCFYVSAERVRNPFLIGKPVGVLGNQGACVIAKSYEMKAAGVKTGEPIWEAHKKCPQGIFIKRDFRWYEALSRRMLDVLREFVARVEYYSIDEFFFEAELGHGQSPQELAVAIRDRLKQKVNIPVTVGIARSRTLAKLISDSAKPFGAKAVLGADAERELLAGLPVTKISGIASRRARRLEPYGIRTCLDLAKADRKQIRQLLTIAGEVLWWELNGEPVQPLHTERPPHKMLSRCGSLGGPTNDRERLIAWVARNVERLVEELEYHRVAVGRLEVFVMHWDGVTSGRRITLTAPTDRFDRLFDAARHCFLRAWIPGLVATHMHIIATDLRRPGAVQLGLFDPPDETARALAALKRTVNARVGRFALRSGATLPLYDLYRDEAQSYDICDVRGKHCF